MRRAHERTTPGLADPRGKSPSLYLPGQERHQQVVKDGKDTLSNRSKGSQVGRWMVWLGHGGHIGKTGVKV